MQPIASERKHSLDYKVSCSYVMSQEPRVVLVKNIKITEKQHFKASTCLLCDRFDPTCLSIQFISIYLDIFSYIIVVQFASVARSDR